MKKSNREIESNKSAQKHSTENTPRDYRGKELVDWSHGHTVHQNTSNAAAMMALSGVRDVTAYESLKTAADREGYLDGIVKDTQNATRNWGEFYTLVAILRDAKWYWEKEGYPTFSEFWHDKTSDAFGTLAELEQVYNFAKIASPELFDMSVEDVTEKTKPFTEAYVRLRTAIAAQGDGSCGSTAGQTRGHYKTKGAAQDRVAVASVYKPPAGNSLERRMMKLKRDAPFIAEQLLAGDPKYIKELSNGTFAIDMNRAEKDVYGKSNSEIQKEKREAKQKETDEELLNKLLKTTSTLRRKTLISTISKCEWLMEALSNDS